MSPALPARSRRLTFDHRPVIGPPTWTATAGSSSFDAWRSCQPVADIGFRGRTSTGSRGHGRAGWPSIPPIGNQLVYEQVVAKFNIWRLELKDQKHSQRPPEVLISEKGDRCVPNCRRMESRSPGQSPGFLGHLDIRRRSIQFRPGYFLHGIAGRARWSPNGVHRLRISSRRARRDLWGRGARRRSPAAADDSGRRQPFSQLVARRPVDLLCVQARQ